MYIYHNFFQSIATIYPIMFPNTKVRVQQRGAMHRLRLFRNDNKSSCHFIDGEKLTSHNISISVIFSVLKQWHSNKNTLHTNTRYKKRENCMRGGGDM